MYNVVQLIMPAVCISEIRHPCKVTTYRIICYRGMLVIMLVITLYAIFKACILSGRPKFYSQSGEDKALYGRYFSRPPICNGVYVELGALDGLRYSNTKFYQDHLNWTGVLIEAQPKNAARLKRNRGGGHNVIIPEAVCPHGEKFVNFTGTAAVGGMPELMEDGHKSHFFKKGIKNVIQVPCRPIGAMLRAAGVSSIDLFSLDVEGAELLVLSTMDWEIPVRVFVIEMGHRERDVAIIQLLKDHGYRKTTWDIRKHCPPGDCANNQVFENTNLTHSS